MGATCTRLDISPEATTAIQNGDGRRRHFIVHDVRFETVWRCLGPYINGAVERNKMRRLLQQYLEANPCRDRYLGLTLGDRRWVFEIVTNRCGGECTEILLTTSPARH